MTSCVFFLDESGDLGWSFALPYRRGGSSRFLTICAVEVPHEHKERPKRVIKRMYDKYKRDPNEEMKWITMGPDHRANFVTASSALCAAHPEIRLHAIVVSKEKVWEHIRRDPNKLYNFMIKNSLLDSFAGYDEATLVPDPRSIRVKSGNSLHDYLQTELWFGKKVQTKLTTNPLDSKKCLGLQFADMVAGTVQSHFEDGEQTNFAVLAPYLNLKTMYF